MVASHTLKLGRALEHAECLEKEVRLWIGEHHPKAFVRDPRTQSNEYLYRFAGVPNPPQTWGLLIGDSLQNLRATLDHIAYELAVTHTGVLTDKQIKDSEFPIYGKAPLSPAKSQEMIGCLAPAPKAFIEGLQPHHRGDYAKEPLWLLHDLSIIDKHRLMHTVASGHSDTGIAAGRNTNVQIFGLYAGTSKPGAVVAHFAISPVDPNLPMYMPLTLTLHVGFEEGPAKGRNPVRTLLDLHRYVRDEVVAPLETFL